ncbi:MAG: M3 family metallopeptidase [Paracoccaceae bacterium]|nr:M3 family metallopeptidase [Paracoccaceae bacterium]
MTNPLLQDWDTPFGLPPFGQIEVAHFAPAFADTMSEQIAEIEAVASDPEAPTFQNTVEAMERTGRRLDQVAGVFFNLCASHTNDALQAAQREMAPRLARHQSAILMNAPLFQRVQVVVDVGTDGLTREQARVLELYHRMFVRAGARLAGPDKDRMTEIQTRLSELGTEFGLNVLADEKDWALFLDEGDLDGLPDFLTAAAAREAKDRGSPGKYAITLSRSSIEPFLTFSTRRDLREAAWRAWTGRGKSTNWPLVEETVRLRAERAKLLGFENFAAFKVEHEMAKTPDAVRDLLMAVWGPARARAREEAGALAALAAEEGANIQIAPWDWRFYSEKQRKREHDLDEAETKPYLQLDAMIEAAFDVAGRLFGLEFREAKDLTLHHPDARAWEVTRLDGGHLGLFIGDYFARPSKRSGAWASGYRSQQKLWEPGRPIIQNTCNFAPPADGQPALLTYDDARTLFHEFGHALHGLMSDVTYPMISGTSVARDFVELPSQLYEHWLSVPEVLGKYARHYRTGEAMPEDLVTRLKAAEKFNQGFATVEYCASALVDLEMHLVDGENFDAKAFQDQVLKGLEMPSEIVMRHATPHFQHVFSGDGYSAGYYSYMWSEVMDADAFKAFEETGDVFDKGMAESLAANIYSAGGRQDPAEAYVAFRGRLPGVEALLEGRGLT